MRMWRGWRVGGDEMVLAEVDEVVAAMGKDGGDEAKDSRVGDAADEEKWAAVEMPSGVVSLVVFGEGRGRSMKAALPLYSTRAYIAAAALQMRRMLPRASWTAALERKRAATQPSACSASVKWSKTAPKRTLGGSLPAAATGSLPRLGNAPLLQCLGGVDRNVCGQKIRLIQKSRQWPPSRAARAVAA